MKKTKTKTTKKANKTSKTSVKARFRDNITLRRDYVNEKYGWSENTCNSCSNIDVALGGLVVLGLVLLLQNMANLIIVGAIGFVFLEIIYYYIAIRGQKKKATYSESFGYKVISTLGAAIVVFVHEALLITIPILIFVYGNHLWTNYMRRKQYEEAL